VRRSQVNADADLAIAYLRSYAGMGHLLETLNLKRVDADNSPDENDLTPVDLAQLCPSTTPLEITLDREALNRKVKEMLENQSSGFMGNRPKPVENVTKALPPGNVDSEIPARTTAWRSAWVARDVKGYLGFYAQGFKPDGGLSRDDWARQREQRVAKASGIRVEIQDLVVRK